MSSFVCWLFVCFFLKALNIFIIHFLSLNIIPLVRFALIQHCLIPLRLSSLLLPFYSLFTTEQSSSSFIWYTLFTFSCSCSELFLILFLPLCCRKCLPSPKLLFTFSSFCPNLSHSHPVPFLFLILSLPYPFPLFSTGQCFSSFPSSLASSRYQFSLSLKFKDSEPSLVPA